MKRNLPFLAAALRTRRESLQLRRPSIPRLDFRGKGEGPRSLQTSESSTTKSASPRYTGTKLLGISAMHKSNLVPVFSEEEAKDQAKMRKG